MQALGVELESKKQRLAEVEGQLAELKASFAEVGHPQPRGGGTGAAQLENMEP